MSTLDQHPHQLLLYPRFQAQFIHAGRDYTLIKRKQATRAPWYLRMVFRGKKHWRSTNTNDVDLATQKAKPIIDAILHDDFLFLNTTKRRDPVKYATLGHVFDVYRAHQTDTSKSIEALCTMMRLVFGEQTEPMEIRITNLTPPFVRAFQTKCVEQILEQDMSAGTEQTALLGAKQSANHFWSQARLLFVEPMMVKYREAGLIIPRGFDALAETPLIKLSLGPTTMAAIANAQPQPLAEARMYTVKQAAELFSMSRTWIRDRITAGELDGYLCGNLLISGQSINHYFATRSLKGS